MSFLELMTKCLFDNFDRFCNCDRIIIGSSSECMRISASDCLNSNMSKDKRPGRAPPRWTSHVSSHGRERLCDTHLSGQRVPEPACLTECPHVTDVFVESAP